MQRFRRSDPPNTITEPPNLPVPETKTGSNSFFSPNLSDDKSLLSYFILIILVIILFCFGLAVVKKIRENRSSRNNNGNGDGNGDQNENRNFNISANGDGLVTGNAGRDENLNEPIHVPEYDLPDMDPASKAMSLENIVPIPNKPPSYWNFLVNF